MLTISKQTGFSFFSFLLAMALSLIYIGMAANAITGIKTKMAKIEFIQDSAITANNIANSLRLQDEGLPAYETFNEVDYALYDCNSVKCLDIKFTDQEVFQLKFVH